jgi:hypothetical protein
MSPRLLHPKKHFVEIFADNFDFTLTSFARSGFSNGGIAIQIESAMSENPDFILLNLTNSDRIEFSAGDGAADETFGIWQLGDCHDGTKELSDSFYEHGPHKKLVSENLYSILNNVPVDKHYQHYMRQKYDNWDDKVLAIKSYFKYLYDGTWKNSVDQMMMHTILYKLHKSNIPHILVHDSLGLTLNRFYYPDWFTQKHSVHEPVNEIRLTNFPKVGKDPGFHLTYEGSQAVANILIEHYNRYFNLHIEHSK